MNWEESLIKALERHIEEDQKDRPVYDKAFFQSLMKYRPTYHFLADLMIEHLKPKSVIDLGCGCGFILEKMLINGIIDIHGIESSEEVIPFISENLIPFIDISDVLLCAYAHYDLAVTIEVAEHIPEKDAAKFVNNICNSAEKFIWWTAAVPGQKGTGHINCKPQSYWESIFKEVGLFEPDWEQTYVLKQKMLVNHQLCLGFPWLRDNFILWRKL